MIRGRPLRGAILGVGNVALEGHVPGWARRADVVLGAAADPRIAARDKLASRLPGIAWYDSAERLLDSEEVDFVDICTPPAAHGPLIRLALERGVHVLCEKPLVLDSGELAELSRLAARQNLALSTVHNWRYAPCLARASELVRAEAIGEVRRCRWEVFRSQPAAALPADSSAGNWRVDPAVSGGGIFVDHGWHALYLVHGWIGRPPRRVRAKLEKRRHADWPVEDTAEVWIDFGDAEAEIFLTWAGEERRNRIVIEGTLGRIVIDGRVLELSRRPPEAAGEVLQYPQALSEGSHHPDWFAGVAAEFLAAISNPVRRGAALEEAAFCLSVIRLAYESSLRGDVVALDAPASEALENPAAAGDLGGSR